MTRLASCLLLLATGASAGQTFHVEAFGNIDRGGNCVHDEERGVTCYVFYGGHFGGISCISDSQPQASNQRQLSQHETQPEPPPALAPGRWIDERYEL